VRYIAKFCVSVRPYLAKRLFRCLNRLTVIVRLSDLILIFITKHTGGVLVID
jgi:hypothetical protein